jgi:hypothetical protein
MRTQHMLALYRSGRHAEALASYQAVRKALGDELRVEPTAFLKELERKMLRQDPTLERETIELGASVRCAKPPPALLSASTRRFVMRGRRRRIAYQVVGDGPLDLVLVHGWVYVPAGLGSIPSSPTSTAAWRRSGGSSSSTSAAPASRTAWHPISCRI